MNAFTEAKYITAAGKAAHPLVPGGSQLLLESHEHNGMLLDLYGHFDDDGAAYVWYVALPGDKRDLSMLFSENDLDRFSSACHQAAIEARDD